MHTDLLVSWRPLARTRACSLNEEPNGKAGDVGAAETLPPQRNRTRWRLKNEAPLRAYSTGPA